MNGPIGTTVVVIDDEPAMRRLMCRVFQADGWTTHAAEDGEAGLRLIQGAEPPVELVVTDVRMPNIGGREVIAVLREHRPELPLICVTAFVEGAIELAAITRGQPPHVLKKPFTPELLVAAGRALVEAARINALLSRPFTGAAAARSDTGEHPAVDLVAAARDLRQRGDQEI